MSDAKLMGEKAPDQFTTESPIRAFTEFRVAGCMAIGKGFRPSAAHLHTYLDAMARKESWRFVQLLHVDTKDMTIIFERQEFVQIGALPEPSRPAQSDLGAPHGVLLWTSFGKHVEHSSGIYENGRWWIVTSMAGDEITRKIPAKVPNAWKLGIDTPWMRGGLDDLLPGENAIAAGARAAKLFEGADVDGETIEFVGTQLGERDVLGDGSDYGITPLRDDPVNPAHYAGRECADIGERLTANSYQVLKYNWRLGKKDDPCQEIDKSLWYLDSEIALANARFTFTGTLPEQGFFQDRLKGQDEYVRRVAYGLISWCRHPGVETLVRLRADITNKRARLDCGAGLAI